MLSCYYENTKLLGLARDKSFLVHQCCLVCAAQRAFVCLCIQIACISTLCVCSAGNLILFV